MSFEKPSTTPTPEQRKPKASTPEAAENQESRTEQAGREANERTLSNLSPENQNFFRRMSEGGRRIASRVYEGLYKIPGVNRVVGKIEIAYNQFWMDRYQGKAVEMKNKIDGLDLRISALDQSKKEIESVIENLRQQNIPGAESLQLKLQDIERQRMELLNKRDNIQTRFEAIDNKAKLYTNARDRIADRLIGYYEEKLRPMEAELERLGTYKDEIDLREAVTEAKHKEQLLKLDDIEKKKAQIEEALRGAGMSKKAIRRFEAVKQLERIIAENREKIRIEKENFARQKAETERKIARVDARANPYRDKREEFARVKEGRPIKIDIAARKRGEAFRGREEIRTHRREEAVSEEQEVLTKTIETETETAREKGRDGERRQTIAYIDSWNAYLREKYKNAGIDAEDFLEATGLSANDLLDFKDFKNILGRYLKFRKLSIDQFHRSIDRFFEERVKVKK